MIDLHCHILPGVDDGSPDLAHSLEMARIAVAEGISIQACTPHMYPGVYNNKGADVRARIVAFQQALDDAAIPLTLVPGADVHVAPNLVTRLRSGDALTLNDSRYLLLEPPHHILPPRIEESFFTLLAAGFVPLLTHPERMTWIEHKYPLIEKLSAAGALMQVTAGAFVGQFGARAKYWAERMLDNGLVQVIATDAHDIVHRPPRMRSAFEALCKRVGDEESANLVYYRPLDILENRPPAELAETKRSITVEPMSFLRRILNRWSPA